MKDPNAAASSPMMGRAFGWQASLLGLVLMVIGVLMQGHYSLVMSNLTISVALAIMCVGFGAIGEIRDRRVTLGGAAAIAVVFFVLVGPTTCAHKLGFIESKEGRFDRAMNIEIRADRKPILGAMDPDRFAYHFLIEDVGLREPAVLSVLPAAGEDIRDYKLDVDKVAALLPRREKLGLYLSDDEVLEVEGNEIVGKRVSGRQLVSSTTVPVGSSLFGVREAVAADVAPDVGPENTAELLDLLKAPELRLRLDARQELIDLGPNVMPTLVARWRGETDQAAQLDLLNTLLAMMATNDTSRGAARDALSEADVQRIVDMVDSRDEKVRWLGIQFLLELEDPRGVAPLMTIVTRPTSSNESRRAAAYVLEMALGWLPADRAEEVTHQVKATAHGVQDKRTRTALGGFGEKRYFLVVRSFKRQNDAVGFATDAKKRYEAAQVHEMTNGVFVVTLGEFRLPNIEEAKRSASQAGVAADDAWWTLPYRFRRLVF